MKINAKTEIGAIYREIQSPLKLLEQQGQFLYFCCTLKSFGVDTKK